MPKGIEYIHAWLICTYGMNKIGSHCLSHSLSLSPSLFLSVSIFFALIAHTVFAPFRPGFPLSCLCIPDPARLFLLFYICLSQLALNSVSLQISGLLVPVLDN